MARRCLQVIFPLALVIATATLSSAQTAVQPAAFPAMPSCPPAPLSLSPCIGYVFGVGSATLSSCCSQLRSFLQAQAPCICAASKLAPSPIGLFLGQAQSMIPNVCNLTKICIGYDKLPCLVVLQMPPVQAPSRRPPRRRRPTLRLRLLLHWLRPARYHLLLRRHLQRRRQPPRLRLNRQACQLPIQTTILLPLQLRRQAPGRSSQNCCTQQVRATPGARLQAPC
uniref:Uncharacterized protein n=1 Tax=Arundo donax TaxID=35708 RepID=A0A0A8ZSS7_ARUDO